MVHSPGLMEKTDGMEWLTAQESTGHMGHVEWHRAGEGSLPVGSFLGRTLDWRLERWETGWPVSLRPCGTAELVPAATDGSGFTDLGLMPASQQWVPHRKSELLRIQVSTLNSEVENMTAKLASCG